MDIFEFAMQMERDGEKYYRELAAKCDDRGLNTILLMLADAEVSHYEVLKKMAKGADPGVTETKLLSNVKNIFARMNAKGKVFDFDISQVDFYKKACDLEKKSEEFYREKATAAPDSVQREIFEKMATEERQHYVVLSNMIEFISRPNTWLENAEWHHLDEY